MAIQGFQAKQNEQGEMERTVLPEDSYQCVIDKVELREGTKYMSTEKETQLLFYLRPLTVGPEFERKMLFYQTTTSFFNGKSSSTKQGLKASKLFGLIRTVYRFYKPDVKVEDMKPEDITDTLINELEGKQLVAIVKVNENGNNKVSDIMSIKEEVKLGETMTPDQELQKVLS